MVWLKDQLLTEYKKAEKSKDRKNLKGRYLKKKTTISMKFVIRPLNSRGFV